MFRAKTVFVVGAGASAEIGLPTGSQLKNEISKLLDIQFPDGWNQTSGDGQITAIIRKIAEDSGQRSLNPYLMKAWRIRDAIPAAISIDNFLDAHRGDEMMEICGKLAIVKSILNAEAQSSLSKLRNKSKYFSFSDVGGSWLIPFFQMLSENVRKSSIESIFDNVSLIVFNYDRCIEQFLPFALSTYYDLDDAEAQAIAKKAKIIHPYGQVGLLPWQAGRGTVPFGEIRCDLLEVSRGIRTFTEGLSDESRMTDIRNAILSSEAIVFLGFAFHPINMQIISAGESAATKRVFGTTYGLSDADVSVVRDDILKTLEKDDPILNGVGSLYDKEIWREIEEIELNSLDSVTFLKQYFRSISRM